MTTTRPRIVYMNASAKDAWPSLNDCLHTGPSFAPDILYILTGFRLHPVVVVAGNEMAIFMTSVKVNYEDSLWYMMWNLWSPRL